MTDLLKQNYLQNLEYSSLANGNKSALLLSDGSVYLFGGDEPKYDNEGMIRKFIFPKQLSFSVPIIQVAIGNISSLFLSSMNTLYGLGSNQFGQFGVSPQIVPFSHTPLELDLSELHNKQILQIATGISMATSILTVDGMVYTTGSMCGREVSSGNFKFLPIPPDCFQHEQVVSISEGGCHKLFITSSGTVYILGVNILHLQANGILGLGPSAPSSTNSPTRLETLWQQNIRIVKGSAGQSHSLVIDSNGNLYGWGGNRNGELGLPSLSDFDTPTPIFITKHDSITEELVVCQSVCCGNNHSLVLTRDGQVYAFGVNHFGQLGISIPHLTTTSTPTLIETLKDQRVLSVSAGSSHSLFVMDDSPSSLASLASSSSEILGNKFRVSGLSHHNQLGIGNSPFLQPILVNGGRDTSDCLLQPLQESHDVLVLSLLEDEEVRCSYKEQKRRARQMSRKKRKLEETQPAPIPVPEEEQALSSPPPSPPRLPLLSSESDLTPEEFSSLVTLLHTQCYQQHQEWFLDQLQLADERSDDDALDELENPSNSTFEKLLGETLWTHFQNSYPPDGGGEGPGATLSRQYALSLEAVVSYVEGFSDYREVFAPLFHYLTKGIQLLSGEIAARAVEVCQLLYSTNEVDTFYHDQWAGLVLQRALDSFVKITQGLSMIKTVEDEIFVRKETTAVLEMMESLLRSGGEYEEEVKAASALRKSLSDLVSQSLKLYQSAACARMRTNTIFDQQLHRLLSLCADTTEEKLWHLNSRTFTPPSSSLSEQAEVERQRPNLSEEFFQHLDKTILSNSLLEAYNSMCDETDSALALQHLSLSSQLTFSALSVLHHMTESDEAEQAESYVLMESLMWFSLLLQWWDETSEEHMRLKRTMADQLRGYGLIEELIRQMEFWAVEWEGCYGDCGTGAFLCLKSLCFYFPEITRHALLSARGEGRVVEMIRSQSHGKSRHENDRTSCAQFIMSALA
jgi:alpha-tubulin suppressor-like RCC1 family protein